MTEISLMQHNNYYLNNKGRKYAKATFQIPNDNPNNPMSFNYASGYCSQSSSVIIPCGSIDTNAVLVGYTQLGCDRNIGVNAVCISPISGNFTGFTSNNMTINDSYNTRFCPILMGASGSIAPTSQNMSSYNASGNNMNQRMDSMTIDCVYPLNSIQNDPSAKEFVKKFFTDVSTLNTSSFQMINQQQSQTPILQKNKSSDENLKSIENQIKTNRTDMVFITVGIVILILFFIFVFLIYRKNKN